jgi:dUTPase
VTTAKHVHQLDTQPHRPTAITLALVVALNQEKRDLFIVHLCFAEVKEGISCLEIPSSIDDDIETEMTILAIVRSDHSFQSIVDALLTKR